jgi:hypothetical protein
VSLDIFVIVLHIKKLRTIYNATCDLLVSSWSISCEFLLCFFAKLIVICDVQSCDMLVFNLGLLLTVCECDLSITCVASFVKIKC